LDEIRHHHVAILCLIWGRDCPLAVGKRPPKRAMLVADCGIHRGHRNGHRTIRGFISAERTRLSCARNSRQPLVDTPVK
jgi:hypothetical protein